MLYPTGHGRVGLGVRVFVHTAVPEGDTVEDNMGVAAADKTGLPDMDDVVVNKGLPDTDGVAVPDDDPLMVGVGDFKTATLRLMTVAMTTPASLASQE